MISLCCAGTPYLVIPSQVVGAACDLYGAKSVPKVFEITVPSSLNSDPSLSPSSVAGKLKVGPLPPFQFYLLSFQPILTQVAKSLLALMQTSVVTSVTKAVVMTQVRCSAEVPTGVSFRSEVGCRLSLPSPPFSSVRDVYHMVPLPVRLVFRSKSDSVLYAYAQVISLFLLAVQVLQLAMMVFSFSVPVSPSIGVCRVDATPQFKMAAPMFSAPSPALKPHPSLIPAQSPSSHSSISPILAEPFSGGREVEGVVVSFL